MRKLVIAVGASLLAFTAQADFIDTGFFAAGFVDTGFFDVTAGGGDVTVPNVIGLTAAAADVELEAVMLDTGTVTQACSAEPATEVLSQNPFPGAMVPPATLVDLLTSTGVACPASTEQRTMGTGIFIGLGE